ncbi:MAG: DUF1150 family protein [Acetobacteraceae bacterium]
MYMSSSNEAEGEGRTVVLTLDIRHLSAGQLAALGMAEVAFVKNVVVNDVSAFAIHAADGTPMGVAADEKVAMAAIRQHGMEPALVH